MRYNKGPAFVQLPASTKASLDTSAWQFAIEPAEVSRTSPFVLVAGPLVALGRIVAQSL